MSFKKQQPYQPDMFKVPLLPSRLEKYLYDPKASHNLFYHNVYCKIPEDIFTPLYCTGNGRPNANVRMLVAMRIFKEGGGYTHNVTETCDDEDKATTVSGIKIKKPKLIVHVDVQPASTPDTHLYEPGVKGAMDVTGHETRHGAETSHKRDEKRLLAH